MARRADPAAAGVELATPVAVTIGAEAAAARRAVGPTAWCALEVLATTPAVDGEPWIVQSSVRDVAARVGVAKNTAQRALAVLRDAGLVTADQRRRDSGQFGATAYRLTVGADVLGPQPRESRIAISQTARTRQAGAKPRAASKAAVAPAQQLVLLPSA
jgi:DNA-binding transcriptional ArsR family regulator